MKVKGISYNKQWITKHRVEDDNDVYERIVWDNGNIEWKPVSYDGETEDGFGHLERKYQGLINKPVTTTNELPLSVKICEAIVNTPDNASTARLWATLAEISDLCKGK